MTDGHWKERAEILCFLPENELHSSSFLHTNSAVWEESSIIRSSAQPKQGCNNQRMLGNHLSNKSSTRCNLNSNPSGSCDVSFSSERGPALFILYTFFSTQGGMSLNAYNIVSSSFVGVGDSLLGCGTADFTLQTLRRGKQWKDETAEVRSTLTYMTTWQVPSSREMTFPNDKQSDIQY